MKQAIVKPYCRNCTYFYGKTHALGALVCAVHPYGPEDEHCPDWESKLPGPTSPQPSPCQGEGAGGHEIEIVWAERDRSLWRKLLRRLRRNG